MTPSSTPQPSPDAPSPSGAADHARPLRRLTARGRGEAHRVVRSSRQAFVWGYGHYVVFASAAAIGAGLEVAVEQAVGKAHLSTLAASAAVTLPTALYLLTVWGLHARHFKVGLTQQLVLPVTALLVICCTFLGEWAVLAAGLVTAPAVATGTTLTARTAARKGASRASSAAV